MAFLALLLTIPTGYCQGPFDPHRNAEQDLLAAEKIAAAEHKRILLDFGANWCEPCVSLDRTLETDPELKRLLSAGFVVVRINIDLDRDSEGILAVRRLYPQFTLVPHLLVVAPDGRLLKEQPIAPLLSDPTQWAWNHQALAAFLKAPLTN